MSFNKIAITLSLWLVTVFPLFAQQISVSGKVIASDDKQPIPGVNVLNTATGLGTTTDLEGQYKINVDKDATLQFSFIGLKTTTIAVNGRTQLNVSLAPNIAELGEVVVVGYGSVEKKLLTGSVAQADEETLSNTINPDISSSLQGKVAGVQINQNSGTPGGALSIQVRGQNSISGGTQPLYVIDGIPVNSSNLSQIGYEGQGISALSDLNPNDIASISILKDASASAIYGARGANGVVLITTKSGKQGKTRVSVSSYYGVQQIYKKLDLLNAAQFKEYLNDYAAEEGRPPEFTEEEIANDSVDTNWQDAVLRIAPIQNHQVSLNGGDENTKFYSSVSYFDQEGIIIGTDYNRLNARLNIDHKLSDKLSFNGKAKVSYSVNNRVPGDQTINGVLPNAISKPPNLAIFNDDGSYAEQGFWDNPVANGSETDNVAKSFRTILNMGWTYNITGDLKFTNQWGVDYTSLSERRFEPTTTRRGAQNNGIAISANSNNSRIVQNSYFTYSKYINKTHDISVVAGNSFEIESDEFDFIRANNFPSNESRYVVSAGNIESATAGASQYRINSFFGRVMYGYKDKYLLTVNARADGSSNIAPDNRYELLPGVSLGWRIIEESFMQNQSVVNDLKLRLGYGRLGNDRIGRGAYQDLYDTDANYNGNPGVFPEQIENPALKWEVTTNYNLGVDAGFLNGRLQFTTDIYYNLTTDLLLSRPLPGSSGYDGFRSNVGEMANYGLEMSLDANLIDNDELRWSINGNITFNRNEVLALYDNLPITEQGRGNNAAIEGEPIGTFFMLKSLGVDPSSGELVIDDLNNDNQITNEDRQIVGNPNPDLTGGLSTKLVYKQLDLSVVAQFSYGNEVYNGTRQYIENMTFGDNDNQSVRILRRWNQPGDITNVPKINGAFNNQINSHYLEDGSFFRIRNITLGYNLSEAILEKIGIQKVRVYASLQNILTLTSYTGMDPDVNYSGNSSLRQGTDFFTYPNPEMFTAGVNITF